MAEITSLTSLLALTITLSVLTAVSIYLIIKNRGSKCSVDDTYSTRNSQKWPSLGLWLYACGMGTWILTMVPDIGASAGLVAILFYAFSICSIYIITIKFGSAFRDYLGKNKSFMLSDYLSQRYNKSSKIIVDIITMFTLYMGLSAEFLILKIIFRTLSPNLPTFLPGILVGSVALLINVFGGSSASMLSNVYQSLILILSLIVLTISTIPNLSMAADSSIFISTLSPSLKATITGLALFITLIPYIFFDAILWQAVFSAKNNKHLKFGFILCGVLAFVTLLIFGIFGMLIKSDPNFDGSDNVFIMAFLKAPNILTIFFIFVVVVLDYTTISGINTAIISLTLSNLQKTSSRIQRISVPITNFLISCLAIYTSLAESPVLNVYYNANVAILTCFLAIGFSKYTIVKTWCFNSSILAGILGMFAARYWMYNSLFDTFSPTLSPPYTDVKALILPIVVLLFSAVALAICVCIERVRKGEDFFEKIKPGTSHELEVF